MAQLSTDSSWFFFSGICATYRKTLRALFIEEKEAATETSPSVAMEVVSIVEEMENHTLEASNTFLLLILAVSMQTASM